LHEGWTDRQQQGRTLINVALGKSEIHQLGFPSYIQWHLNDNTCIIKVAIIHSYEENK
jgi:hypothetical protein